MAMTVMGLRTTDENGECAILGKQGVTLLDARVRRHSERV